MLDFTVGYMVGFRFARNRLTWIIPLVILYYTDSWAWAFGVYFGLIALLGAVASIVVRGCIRDYKRIR